MKDLTKNKTAFGLMSDKGQRALREAFDSGETLLYYSRYGGWVPKSSDVLNRTIIYRLAKPTQDEIDWSHVSDDIVAIARNEGMTKSWLYIKAPTAFSDSTWMGGTTMGTTKNFASYKRGTCEAKDSLVLRPKGGA